MCSKAQYMGEARDREAMGILMRQVTSGIQSNADAEAIKNFCCNETIQASTKQARIAMYNEAMGRSLFVEQLPVGVSRDQVKRLMQSKLFASAAAVHVPDAVNNLCSVFVNKPPECTEYMYAVVTMNDARHAHGIISVMDKELVEGTKTRLMVENIGVSVQLKARKGESPTSQSLARSYGLFIERHKADLRHGVAPKLPSSKTVPKPMKPLATTSASIPTPAPAPAPAATCPPPLVKGFSETAPKKMAVFHDAENCYLGKARPGVKDGELAYNFYTAVRDLVIAEGGDGSGTWQLFLHHQEHLDSHPSKLTMEELSSLGVDNIDPGPKSGAVDIKMKDNISAFCEANKATADSFIVVILSGDKDFSADLRNLQRAGYNTVVAHPPHVAKAFISLAKETGPVVEWQPIRQAAGGLDFGDAVSGKKYRPPMNSRVAGYCGTPSAASTDRWESWADTCYKPPGTPQRSDGRSRHWDDIIGSRQWDELAAIRKTSSSTSSDGDSGRGGHGGRSDDDDCASVSSITGSECSSSSMSQISSVTSPCTPPPSVSQWLEANKLTFATEPLQEFGYTDDDFTLLDFAEDVKDSDTLGEILKVVSGIAGVSVPRLNKMKRALKQLASSGMGDARCNVNLAAATA